MRLGLTQQLRAEQRLAQSPQMIQAMKILQCPMMELRDRIDQELQENVFLETSEGQERERETAEAARTGTAAEQNEAPVGESLEEKLQSQFSQELEQLEMRTARIGPGPGAGQARSLNDDEDGRLDLISNTPGPGISLSDYLLAQARMQDLPPELMRVVEHVVFSLDEEGRLHETAEQLAADLLVPIPLAEEAIEVVREFDPPGIGARDLRDCLLMQLDRMNYVKPLTHQLVERHLDDLAMNKLPKISKETGASIDEIKESWEFLKHQLNPHPGSIFARSVNATVIPDVVVEEVEGRYEVRAERGSVPDLGISPVYRTLLKEARSDPKVYEYLRKKIEAAKWFIEAVHQRQSTIQRIAGEIVRRQESFLREGIKHLKPMRMQDIADAVGVSISTVSRAISGKYIQTPQGIFDMKRFFSGGTVTDSGEVVSQQAVKDTLKDIVEREDKNQPLSDDELVATLAQRGVHIARRTVTKYRKALGIESSSRRKQF
jgi:RNA polymerase sigma-54 factor